MFSCLKRLVGDSGSFGWLRQSPVDRAKDGDAALLCEPAPGQRWIVVPQRLAGSSQLRPEGGAHSLRPVRDSACRSSVHLLQRESSPISQQVY
jgi:hypothetical protein